MIRPASSEYNPFYETYVGKVPDTNPIDFLDKQGQEILQHLGALTEAQWMHRYAPEKWSLKELFLHMIDAERVFSYRAMRIARGDKTPLPGFDQNEYVPASKANERSPTSLLEEYTNVRASTLSLLRSFSPEMIAQVGAASGSPISVKALAFIIPGHELHHLQIIKERYLVS